MLSSVARSLRSTVRPLMGEASSSRSRLSTATPPSMRFAAPFAMIHSSAHRMQLVDVSGKNEDSAAGLVDEPSAQQSAHIMPTLMPGEVLPESFRAAQTSSSPMPGTRSSLGSGERMEAHRLHVQSTRNNVIMTLTTHDGAVVQRVSSGSVGFRKAARSGYEAAYRVAMTMFQQIEQNRVTWRLASLDVVWKGFGQGREAVYRAMLSNEGTEVRNLVKQMSDNTAIKIGGVRPKKRRSKCANRHQRWDMKLTSSFPLSALIVDLSCVLSIGHERQYT